jgi:hypothetical protein
VELAGIAPAVTVTVFAVVDPVPVQPIPPMVTPETTVNPRGTLSVKDTAVIAATAVTVITIVVVWLTCTFPGVNVLDAVGATPLLTVIGTIGVDTVLVAPLIVLVTVTTGLLYVPAVAGAVNATV